MTGTRQWDRELVHPEDVPALFRTRPAFTNVNDTISWTWSKTGQYTVKTGYHLKRKLSEEKTKQNKDLLNQDQDLLFKKVWNIYKCSSLN